MHEKGRPVFPFFFSQTRALFRAFGLPSRKHAATKRFKFEPRHIREKVDVRLPVSSPPPDCLVRGVPTARLPPGLVRGAPQPRCVALLAQNGVWTRDVAWTGRTDAAAVGDCDGEGGLERKGDEVSHVGGGAGGAGGGRDANGRGAVEIADEEGDQVAHDEAMRLHGLAGRDVPGVLRGPHGEAVLREDLLYGGLHGRPRV